MLKCMYSLIVQDDQFNILEKELQDENRHFWLLNWLMCTDPRI